MTNREYKSDVFSMLLSEPEYALQVYNGLNNSDYTDPSMVEIKTLENGISLTVRNDAAFIVGSDLNLYEHQSRYNANMALRQFIYFARTIEGMIDRKDLFSRKRIPIPFPHFVVFYNGVEGRTAVEIQRLSEHFTRQDESPEMDLKCVIYNINPGNNEELINKCPVLDGYMQFVEKVRDNKAEGQSDKEAVENAIDDCVSKGILAEFFKRRRNEVTKVIMIDMTFEAREKLIREEERAEGREEGRIKDLAQMLSRGGTEEDLKRFHDASEDEIKRARQELLTVR